jgi:hypothetical protein
MHVGMLNSYNILMGHTTIEKVIESGLGIFAHSPDEDPSMYTVHLIMQYFQDLEMYEYCYDLIEYIQDNFNEDGSAREEDCKCDYPSIAEYTKKVKCSECNKRIRK